MNWAFQETRLFLATAGHCRGPPASGVFMISNSDSEKGWVFSKTRIGRGLHKVGSPFNLFVALYLYLHLCILLCQHEVVSPLGNPGLLGASMCLWYCICKYMCICVFIFVYLSLAARGGESFGKSRITRGLRKEENSDQLYNNLQMRAFAQHPSLHRSILNPLLYVLQTIFALALYIKNKQKNDKNNNKNINCKQEHQKYTTTCKWKHLLNTRPCIYGSWILDCHLQLWY